MTTTPIELLYPTSDQSDTNLRWARQVSEEFKESFEEVQIFDKKSTRKTNEALGQDTDKPMEIVRKLSKTPSIRNNNDMKSDDNTTKGTAANDTTVNHAVDELAEKLKTLIDDEVPFGEAEATSQPSTGEQCEVCPSVIEGNTPFESFKQVVSSERFDEIIRKYKKSIQKGQYRLNELDRDELVKIITHIRSDFFVTDPSIPSSYDINDNDDETQKEENRDKILRYLVQQSETHDKLLKQIIAGMQPPTPVVKPAQQRSPVADRVVQAVLGVMLPWALITVIRISDLY